MTRILLAVISLAATLGGSERAPRPPVSPLSAAVYRAPLPGRLRILRPFIAPAGPYGAGHRGVDLAAQRGAAVLAAANGVVTFSGRLARRGVIVIAHPDGVRTEYEPVRPRVRAGDQVRAGVEIGTLDGVHGGCPPNGCLHWGARRGAQYFDPLRLLRPLGPVRLIPWPGDLADP
jgi:murein DD-endopeptidase MepM/ murein hydrolase activator NlpD